MGSIHAEFVKGIVMYSKTGERPHDHFYDQLAKQFDKNPAKFTAAHPRFAPFMTPAAHVGDLPGGHYWANLEHRYHMNPGRFETNHCEYIVRAIKTSMNFPSNTFPITFPGYVLPICAVPSSPANSSYPTSLPEPSSIVGFIILPLIYLFKRKS